MSELKTCAHCGKPGRIVKGFAFPVAVGCDTPTCHNYIGKDSRGYETEEEATEAWNTRHEKTAEMLIGLLDLGIVGCSECGMANNFLDNVPKYCCHCGSRLIKDERP